MLLVIYDIASDAQRAKFAKFLKRYGRRIQYSVFEIYNSARTLENIKLRIETEFSKKFEQADSVMILSVPDSAIIERYGYSANEDSDLLIF